MNFEVLKIIVQYLNVMLILFASYGVARFSERVQRIVNMTIFKILVLRLIKS